MSFGTCIRFNAQRDGTEYAVLVQNVDECASLGKKIIKDVESALNTLVICAAAIDPEHEWHQRHHTTGRTYTYSVNYSGELNPEAALSAFRTVVLALDNIAKANSGIVTNFTEVEHTRKPIPLP